jgi:hypothetical protein
LSIRLLVFSRVTRPRPRPIRRRVVLRLARRSMHPNVASIPSWLINSHRGFSIAGTEYGTECYCGNSFVGGTPATAPSTDCMLISYYGYAPYSTDHAGNVACSGDSSLMCGAGWRLNIYSSSGSSTSSSPATSTSTTATSSPTSTTVPTTGNGPFPVNAAYHDPSPLPASAIGLFVR